MIKLGKISRSQNVNVEMDNAFVILRLASNVFLRIVKSKYLHHGLCKMVLLVHPASGGHKPLKAAILSMPFA